MFKNCSTLTGIPLASQVLGQPNFTSGCASGTALNQMSIPFGLFFDLTTGILWVTDKNNQRVLKFVNAASLSNGSFANSILGVTGSSACSQNQFSSPQGITGDSSGNLWVSDRSNARVLRFSNAASLPSSSNASFVLGQSNFVTCTSGTTTQSIFGGPFTSLINQFGTLFVGDTTNNRVVGFFNAASISTNGPKANFVIGQSNFNSSYSSLGKPTATNLDFPGRVFYDDVVTNSLFVADGFNNRVLRYCSDKSNENEKVQMKIIS